MLDICGYSHYNVKQALHGVVIKMNTKVINRIKELRHQLGISQEELAQAVGVSRQSINSIERGRYIPSLPLALRFAQFFSCATDELFELEENS